jgi:AcrR family transcriptional regulator
VAQVKKIEVRQAILDAAFELFMDQGYTNTKIPQVAKAAGVSPANIYVYFQSKLAILITIYEDWFSSRLADLEKTLTRSHTPAQKLKKLLTTLWRDLPAADNGFVNNLLQALSSTSVMEEYSPALRQLVQASLIKMLNLCLPQFASEKNEMLADFFLMAFDGYALNFHLSGKKSSRLKHIDFLCEMILHYAENSVVPDGPRGGISSR